MEFNKESLVAIARLLVTLILGAGTVFGWSLDGDLVFNIVMSVAAFGSFVYMWWKNNNITAAAQTAQVILGELKEIEEARGDEDQRDHFPDVNIIEIPDTEE